MSVVSESQKFSGQPYRAHRARDLCDSTAFLYLMEICWAKYYFTNRVVPIWNSLPNDVVMVDNINLFKKRLNKFWLLKDFVYSYRAQLLKAGSVK